MNDNSDITLNVDVISDFFDSFAHLINNICENLESHQKTQAKNTAIIINRFVLEFMSTVNDVYRVILKSVDLDNSMDNMDKANILKSLEDAMRFVDNVHDRIAEICEDSIEELKNQINVEKLKLKKQTIINSVKNESLH